MKQGSVPFWWVVKYYGGGYLGEYVNTHVEHRSEAKPYTLRHDAKLAADWWGDGAHRVVKVHARIPDPKLPAWVTPIAFHYRHVQVWRLSEGVCLQYVFSVSAAHVCLTESAVHRRAGINRPSTPWDATADVWTEAAARAAKMLRAMKREKAGQK